MSKNIRNIAIIAHVDHGKTTLVDNLFKQSGTVRENQRVEERAMDSGDLERERGITILAKCTSVMWGDTRINIVDTPGHADFGGEVERILSMVDGVVLLVDAAEGPMPQTKFVTMKALALGLKPIVVVNKVDKPDGDPDAATDAVFDLFVNLDANEYQLDFPILYASGRDGWCDDTLDGPRENLHPLFEKVLEHVPAPKVVTDGNADKPFSMLVSMLDRDNFLGRILTGRIETGRAKVGDAIHALSRDSKVIEVGRISKLLSFRGLERTPVEEAEAGDIVAIAGLQTATVADTIAVPEVKEALHSIPVDPPTLAMTFAVNDSPLAGREGKLVTSRVIRDRLMKEAEGNVAIKITETESKDAFEVAGRGELQLGVLIETMRREGFELAISRPRVLMKMDENCKKLEPYETVQVDVDEAYQGTVVEKMSLRKAELTGMVPSGGGKVRLTFDAPARGLIGYHGEFLTDTRGTGIMNRSYDRYDAYKGPIQGRQRGVLVANASGKAVTYALFNLQERGVIMIEGGDECYEGMIIGEHSRDNDLDVNVQKAKQLTNIRAAGKDEAVKLTTPRKLPLEEALAYINDDELVEVTPESIRLRKRFLLPHERKKAAKAAE
ncbi:translational GTPase TypA [Kordiimonas lipolytica]|uniref:Large ribosomal subunit assembly factor BipA n=1 Tax=Kordiimonas lipolytica TaxID=1662421 RepID=A0ABV8UCW5_9PROT|nr:translational GTPase TypA [Kordiimonas lipolytica]